MKKKPTAASNNSETSPISSADVLVRVENVSKKFCRDLKRSLWYGIKDLSSELLCRRHDDDIELRKDEFWAVKDVSFELKRGECLGLIGRNGAGKTTLLRMLNGLIKPDKGRIEMRGRVGALISLGAGFNPILTGRENIYVNASVLGWSRHETDQRMDEIIEFSELREFIDTPVQSYSSGMTVRLGFAVASTLKPDILLLDEILAVGDANFRSKCWRKIGDLLSESAVILVSHEAYAISRVCDRGIVLENGSIRCDTQSDKALTFYADKNPQVCDPPAKYHHSMVKDFSLTALTSRLTPGQSFKFEFAVETYGLVTVDHAVINITDAAGDVYAQSHIEFPNRSLPTGISVFHLKIGHLYLPKGSYFLMVLISTEGGKVPLIHSRNQLLFDFDSHPSFGPKCYPIGMVRLLSGEQHNHV